jgi:hypothetical protein
MIFLGDGTTKKQLLLQMLFLLFVGGAARAQDKNTIYWTKSSKLQFADFRGRRSWGDHSYIGKTTSTVVPKVKYGKDSFYYEVDCVFDKNNSVIVGHDEMTLVHEQGHFDITEIIARQIRKNLSALSTKAGIADSVNRIIDAAYAEGRRIQEAYEADCGYGDVPDRQEAWSKHIKDMLGALEDYNKTEGTVKWTSD